MAEEAIEPHLQRAGASRFGRTGLVIGLGTLLVVFATLGTLFYTGGIGSRARSGAPSVKTKPQSWKVRVVAGDGSRKPAHAMVWFQIDGTLGGASSPLHDGNEDGAFEANKTSEYTFPTSCVGELRKLTIGYTGEVGEVSTWIIKNADLTDLGTGRTYQFDGGTVAPRNGNRHASLELTPKQP